jgi:hypothetical protein
VALGFDELIFFLKIEEIGMKKHNPKRTLLSTAIAIGLSGGLAATLVAAPAEAAAKHKYLVVWAGDRVIDDGVYGQPDFMAVIDATPGTLKYGKVVNSAVMPAIFGQHLLSETENIVDNADCVLLGNTAECNGNLPYGTTGDALDGGLMIPSSTLNESHHLNVAPRIDATNGHKYVYPGGLISANIFGCDVTDPLNIKPVPGTQLGTVNPMTWSGTAPTNNTCGLAVSSTALSKTSGVDDLTPLPNGNIIVTMIGFKGTIDMPTDTVHGAHTYILGPGVSGAVNDPGHFGNSSIPPTLQTPGGMLEIDYQGHIVGEYAAGIPLDVRYPAGPLAGKRVAPNHFRARYFLGEVDRVQPGVAGTGIDTGPEAHSHGFSIRPDLNSTSPYYGVYHGGTSGATAGSQMYDPAGAKSGIMMTSDYVDPVGLVVSQGYDTYQDTGTTVRFWHMNDLKGGPYAVSEMPDGPRVESGEMHEEPEGLMAMAMTNVHKGAFVASMCGGTIFYSPDVTVPQPKFTGVYDFGPCVGASVFVMSKNDNFLILPKAGIVNPGSQEPNGSSFFNRDMPTGYGEHNREIVVLDVRKLIAAGTSFQCNFPTADKWNNTGPARMADGARTTLGPNPNNTPHPETKTIYWPNNGKADCPTVASRVNLDSPINFQTNGGPHFTVLDSDESHIATSQYFINLSRYPVGGLWTFFNTQVTDTDPLHRDPKGTMNAANGGHCADQKPVQGIVKFSCIEPIDPFKPLTYGLPYDAATVASENNLGFSKDFIPGSGSVGDNTVCMMKFNKLTGVAALDPTFWDYTTLLHPFVKFGCIDFDRQSWPHGKTGGASPHAMTFIETN